MEYSYAYFGVVNESEVIDLFKSELGEFNCLPDGDSRIFESETGDNIRVTPRLDSHAEFRKLFSDFRESVSRLSPELSSLLNRPEGQPLGELEQLHWYEFGQTSSSSEVDALLFRLKNQLVYECGGLALEYNSLTVTVSDLEGNSEPLTEHLL